MITMSRRIGYAVEVATAEGYVVSDARRLGTYSLPAFIFVCLSTVSRFR